MARLASKLLASIESGISVSPPRMHLGASEIGNPCTRALWYSFRWAVWPSFPHRMMRLFQRGHDEEPRFEKLLREKGLEVITHDAETGEQFRIEDCDGHFGGSLDGVVTDVPDMPDEWMLGEFKTHNDKSHQDVVAKGVKASKPRHYDQMQTYMHKKGLKYALYCAVNKNTDALYFEIMEYSKADGERCIRKAETAIYSESPPPKISNRPSWFECKMCQFAGVCHRKEAPMISCRSCDNIVRGENGTWSCGISGKALDKESIVKACDEYRANRHFD